VTENRDKDIVIKGHFDGFYTYFATDGFTFGSTYGVWKQLSQFAIQNNKIFIPSVGTGYADARIRPWNLVNQRGRNEGQYYEHSFKMAVECQVDIISITSWNEWHEGTQIEPAIPKISSSDGFNYLNYLPHSPTYYMERTKYWIELFNSKIKNKQI